MTTLPPTGNPVFDYKREFRARAKRWQKWLLNTALLLLVTALVLAIMGHSRACWAGTLAAGAALLAAGVGWGIHWRTKLRADFQREFGIGNPR